jgi:hypothetical protein
MESAPGKGTCVAMRVRIKTGTSPIMAIGEGKATD